MKKKEINKSNIIVFDPSYGTQNLGDYIITESIENEIKYLLNDYYLIRYSTHNPISKLYQNIYKGPVFNAIKKAKYKFIFGTNTIKRNLFTGHPDININPFDIRFYKGAISIGCGSDIKDNCMNFYTKYIYKKILNKNFIHSVRDNRTKMILESLGFKAINTGCPTLWGITEEICSQIPKEKSDSVVFTLTCYDKKIKYDQQIIDILKKSYKLLYFFPQGADDLEYFYSLNNIDNIEIINPNLKSFEQLLKKDIDYVGTRLHAGIYAIKHKRRSIIIAIDNRAKDMDEFNNLQCVDREDIENELEDRINSSFETKIIVDYDAIKTWKSQFN